MEYVMGLRGKDFAMVCTSATAVQQIVTMKDDEDKILPLGTHTMMATSGEPGDRVQFSEFVAANARLYALRNQATLSTKAVAHFARGELATALPRTRAPQAVEIAAHGKKKISGKRKGGRQGPHRTIPFPLGRASVHPPSLPHAHKRRLPSTPRTARRLRRPGGRLDVDHGGREVARFAAEHVDPLGNGAEGEQCVSLGARGRSCVRACSRREVAHAVTLTDALYSASLECVVPSICRRRTFGGPSRIGASSSR